MLFHEACCSEPAARDLARFLLRALVQAGYDPTDPEVIGPEMEPMDFATITMRLLGWPHRYVEPKYEAQLQRVLRQQDDVCAHRPKGNADWDRGAGATLAAFLNHGRVPTDSRYFLYVLTTGEQFALHIHYFGHGGEDLLAAYEAVATTTGEERAAALRRCATWRGRGGSEVRFPDLCDELVQ